MAAEFLPRYAPDLDPVEIAFAKVAFLIRLQPARSTTAIADALLYPTAHACKT